MIKIENEIWKDIHEFEGKYQISNLGNIKSLARINNQGRWMCEKILKPSYDKDGYLRIGLSKGSRNEYKYFRINRLVALHFVDNLNNLPMVNHINGIRDDNKAENLEWCNNSHNQWHRCHINNNPPNNEYKKRKVKSVKDNEIKIFNSILECAEYYNTSTSAIGNKLHGKVENPSYRRKTDKLYGVYLEYVD